MQIKSLLYSALNLVMVPLLRSPLHCIAGENLCILNYRGQRSSRAYSTPLSCMREGSTLRLLSSRETRWWHNFLYEPVDVSVELAGQTWLGKAEALIDDGERFRDGVRRFLTAVPRDAVVYGIKLDRDRRPREADIESAAGHVVLVEVELVGAPRA